MTRRGSRIIRIGRRIAAVHAEISYAQRWSFAIRTNPDRYLFGGDEAPDTYSEFVFRTSGVSLREPSADRRAHGQPVH